eukprot:8844260-Karenia_brevis.AAC.1
MMHNYGAIAKLVPPRAVAALVRTAWNGWVTGRRFQNYTSRCVFGCAAEDSVEHYSQCKAVHELGARHFGLQRPESPALRLEAFLGLSPRAGVDTLPELRCRVLLTAATYLAHGWLRHHPGRCAATAVQVLRQSLVELGGVRMEE